MSQKFEVDFQDALRQLAQVTAALQGVGGNLDLLEGKNRTIAAGMANLLSKSHREFSNLHDALKKSKEDTEKLGTALRTAEEMAKASYLGMANASLQATTRAEALRGGIQGLDNLLKDTKAKQTYINYALKIADVENDLTNRNKYLRAALIATHTEEAKGVQTRLTKIAGYNKLYTTETRQMLLTKQLSKDLQLQGTEAGRTNSVLQARISVLKSQQQEETLLNGKLEAAKRAYQGQQGAIRGALDIQNVRNKATQESITAEARQAATLEKVVRDLQLMTTATGQALSALQAKATVTKQAQQEDTKAAGTLERLKREQESYVSGIQGRILQQKAVNKGVADAITAEQNEKNALEQLVRVGKSLNGGQQEQIVRQRAINQGRAEAIAAEQKEQNAIADLKRQIASLNGGMGEQLLHLRNQKSVREQEVLQEVRQRQTLADLEMTLRSLNGGMQESIVRAQERIRQRRTEIVEEMRGTAATKALTEAKKEAERVEKALRRAQAEANKQRDAAAEKLANLKAQMDVLTGSHAREISQLERAIQKQKEYNRYLAMTTSELLGFSSASKRANSAINVNNQSGAMLRATLAGLQTSIGMYTSSTILAAASTYGLARAIRSAIEVGSEFGYTLSRVEAIMGAGFGSEIRAGMLSMEEQVRALGQSTRFTASEVAGGLQELGMAGLSAAQSMVALQPALDMALIGNISMAESADIATNVMMQFGLQANELGHVVDVMATAMTSSNTTVTQLANALSYIGPAAESAGISLEDTTAAIEVLANNGIKASRAGTGLRRMFVNMLNPTKEGAAMLDQYGISLYDAEGHTREFGDILGQLHDALYNDVVTPGERTAAVVDLVGVRAASAVTSLIASMGKDGGFEAMRQGLEDVAGASEHMREVMEDNLSTDWKSLVSAFQEAQLTMFDGQEDRMRLLTKQMTSYLAEISKPVDLKWNVDEDGNFTEVVTKIDLIVARVENMVHTLKWAGGAYIGYKVLASGTFSDIASRVTALDGRLKASRASLVSAGTGLQFVSTKAALLQSSAARAAGQTTVLNTALYGTKNAALAAGAGLSTVAIWAGRLMMAAGWIGVALSAATALYTYFSSDAEETLKSQREGLGELKNAYDDLREAIDATAEARRRAAMEEQVGAFDRGIESAEAEKARMDALAKSLEQKGYDSGIATSRSSQLAVEIENMKRSQEAASKALDEMGTTESDVRSLADEVQKLNDQINERNNLLTRAKALSGPALGGGVESPQVRELKAELVTLNQELAELIDKNKKVKAALVSGAEAFAQQLGEVYGYIEGIERLNGLASRVGPASWTMGSLDKAAFDEFATAREKELAAEEKLNEARAKANELKEAQARIDAGIAKDGDSHLVGADNRLRVTEQLAEAELAYQSAFWAAQAERDKANNADMAARAKLAESQMTEEALLDSLKDKYAALNSELIIRQALEQSGSEYATDGLRTQSAIIEELLAIRSRIAGMTKDGTGRESDAERELKRQIGAAQRTYDALAKAIDPVAAAQAEMAEKTKQLDLLLQHGKLSADEYAAGVRRLKLEHYELTLSLDKNRESLENLRDTYLSAEFANEAEDLNELNRLYREGAIEMAEYARIKGEMMERSRESVLSGLPEVNFRNQNGSGTLGNEWMSSVIDRSQGMQQYQDRGDDLFDSYENQTGGIYQDYDDKAAQLQAQLDAEIIAQEVHKERLLQLEQEKNSALLSAHQTYGEQSMALEDSRAAYMAASNKVVMMSAMQSAQSFLGMFASASEEATALQKAAFIAQKALAVATIIMQTEVAAATVQGQTGVFGIPLATMIRATGYASAGMVAAMAIGDLATGGKASSGGNYAGAYDNGGWIPHDKWGIAGEYGPEIVEGPARVTSRRRTANKMRGEGGGSLTIAPQISVTVSGGEGSDSDNERTGKQIAETVKAVVLSTMRNEMRPNGMLAEWGRSAHGS